MKKSAILILLAASIFLVSISTTLAWFANVSYIDNDNLSASVIPGYFRSGDGSAETPFVISTPRHLYNLAWLQYLGELNKVDEKTEKITQYYFKLEDLDDGNADNVIDVDGLVLPPIGTTENPFVGHFDGNGVCIQNLTVSNYLSTNTGGIVERPLSVTTINETTTSIIGFFGVVGAVSNDMQALLIKEDEDADFRSRVNSVHDLFLENLTVRTESTTSLIGLLAGYVNGSVGNVGIGKSSIELGENVRPLTNSEVVKITSLISSYSLIGECNDANVFWIDVPKKTWGDSDDPDSGVGWGGSINFLELRKRIAYIIGAYGLDRLGGGLSGYYGLNNVYGYSGGYPSKQDSLVNGSYFGDGGVLPISATLLEGTAMPLSIDPSWLQDEVSVTHEDISLTLTTTAQYRDNLTNNAEKVLQTNSAYIVGGGSRTLSSIAGTYVDFRLEYVLGGRINGKSFNGGIAKSVGTSLSSSGVFPENNLHLLTNDVNGNAYVISDNDNATAVTWLSQNYNANKFVRFDSETLGFEKYESVRDSFVSGYQGENLLQGLHFKHKIDVNNLETVTVNDVTLMNKSNIDGYEMVKGAINFSLQEDGIATAIVATCNSVVSFTGSNYSIDKYSGVTHSLFSVFSVVRDSNNKIISCTKINKIYEKSDKQGNFVDYVYDITEQDPNYNYKLVFDFNLMSTLSEPGAAYYFEVPLSEGDYVLGSTADSAAGLLLYLDIGANGDQSTEDTTGTEATHSINGLTFVNMNNLEQITVDGKDINSTNGYKVTVFEIDMPTAKDHGGLTMTYERTADKVMTHTETDPSNAFTVQWTESDPAATQSLQLGQVILVNPKRREDSA